MKFFGAIPNPPGTCEDTHCFGQGYKTGVPKELQNSNNGSCHLFLALYSVESPCPEDIDTYLFGDASIAYAAIKLLAGCAVLAFFACVIKYCEKTSDTEHSQNNNPRFV